MSWFLRVCFCWLFLSREWSFGCFVLMLCLGAQCDELVSACLLRMIDFTWFFNAILTKTSHVKISWKSSKLA